MPTPPQQDAFAGINFVTNYYLQGCVPPFWLFIECAQEPAEELLFLLITPDMSDIVEAMFEPKGGRSRRPGRHGRKSGRGIGFPDTSDMVGERIRAQVNPHDALNFGPVRKLAKIHNANEGLNFGVAVVEGIVDVNVGGILGVLTNDPSNCPAMGWFHRKTAGEEFVIGIIQPWNPLNLTELVGGSGDISSSGFGCADAQDSFRVAFAVQCIGYNGPCTNLSFALLDELGNTRAEVGPVDLDDGQFINLNCTALFKAGEVCAWVGRCDDGTAKVTQAEAYGFATSW